MSVVGPLTQQLAKACGVEVSKISYLSVSNIIGIPAPPLIGYLLDRFSKQANLLLFVSLLVMGSLAAFLTTTAFTFGLLGVCVCWGMYLHVHTRILVSIHPYMYTCIHTYIHIYANPNPNSTSNSTLYSKPMYSTYI